MSMKLRFVLSSMVLIACAYEQVAPGVTLESVTVNNAWDLPSCNRKTEGQVRYVASDKTLYACSEREWRVVPTRGPMGASGQSGLSSLIRTVPLAENATECAGLGGVKIETGLDLNNNAMLDSDELQSQLSCLQRCAWPGCLCCQC